jgi:D-3-phosphoglycerate dehydrogenase
MEMNVIAYDPFINAEQAAAMGIQLLELDEIFPLADFITLHLPFTSETKYLLNKERFAKMKPSVRIINCARGGVIHEGDLAEAVEQGIVAGAAIDVFEKEPVNPENPLLKLDQVIVTPHLGASTAEAQVGVAVDVAKGIIAALKGEPIATAVNMAPIQSHVLEVIRPYFNLAEKMGCLAINLAEGRITAVDVEYNGEISEVDTKMLTTAMIKGLLNSILTEHINYVNAPETANFANLITVRVYTDKKTHVVAGTLFGHEEGRIVMIDGYRVDVEPQGWLIVGLHLDRPGMIGYVGTILGTDGININSMQVGRTEVTGTNIMVMSVDSDVPAATMLKIKAVDGILGAKMINFCVI